MTSSTSFFGKVVLLTSLFLSSLSQARVWTSSDGGKTFEGELLNYDPAAGVVVVELVEGKQLSFSEDKLSAADLTFLKNTGESASPGGSQVADMSQPVQVFILLGQSNMLGFGKVKGTTPGALEHAVQEGKYPFLVDENGEWLARKDVRNVRVMNSKLHKNDWLTVADTNKIGPEIGLGSILGDALDAPVLLLKSCIGNRSLGWDLLPPGSERYEFEGKVYAGYKDTQDSWEKGAEPAEGGWYAGKQWDADIASAKEVLAELAKYYPEASSYEVAGFVFWQGDKDRYKAAHASRYEQNLVAFIKALRKEFNAPEAKFVCATLGQTKKGAEGKDGQILEAQLSVDGESGKYEEFKGNVATVYSHPLSQGGASNGHYGGHAETYMDVGLALGRAMAELLK